MRLYIIPLSCLLFGNLSFAKEAENRDPMLFPTLSAHQLKAVMPRRTRFTEEDVKDIYDTLKCNNFSRIETLKSLRKDSKYNTKYHKIILIPMVNQLLQAHLINIHSQQDKSFSSNTNGMSNYEQNKIDFYENIMLDTKFNYKRSSDRAFKMHGPYRDRDHCLTLTSEYEKYLDFLFSAYARPVVVTNGDMPMIGKSINLRMLKKFHS